MRCPKCDRDMEVREGPFGSFYFCPSQYLKGLAKCHQSTITKDKPKPSYSNIGMDDEVDEFGEPIDYMREY